MRGTNGAPLKKTLTTGGTEEHRVERCSGWPGVRVIRYAVYANYVSVLLVTKVEQIRQIADC